jgi:type III restriction enzyme
VTLKQFSEEEQREIQFRDIDSGLPSHVTVMDSLFEPDYQSVVGYFARTIMRDLHLVGGFDVLFGKIKAFIEQELFDQEVALADANVLRNLSEPEATRTLVETMKAGVNALTVQDRGTAELRHQIKLSETRPFLVNDQKFIAPRKSIFNKVTGDNDFELEFAAFLEGCSDIVSFAKNSQSTRFRIEYRNVDGSIANYYPDFLVKQTERDVWIIETKGREDVHDPAKWERLQQWCADATELDAERTYRPLFVSQEDWESYRPRHFEALTTAFRMR